jgi:hypothetical protein
MPRHYHSASSFLYKQTPATRRAYWEIVESSELYEIGREVVSSFSTDENNIAEVEDAYRMYGEFDTLEPDDLDNVNWAYIYDEVLA